MKMIKNNKKDNKSIKFGYVAGIIFLGIGLLLVIFAFILNKSTDVGNPYTKAKKNPQSIEDTFVVPTSADYNKQYHIYLNKDKKGNSVEAYSYNMFKKHEIKDLNFKMEGINFYKSNKKTYLVGYIYNMSDSNELNINVVMDFKYYNDAEVGKIEYKVEALAPLESKLISIDVDEKYINSYDYKLSYQ